jgi:hypothetical protein
LSGFGAPVESTLESGRNLPITAGKEALAALRCGSGLGYDAHTFDR